MRKLVRALVIGGLAINAGPFSLQAQAQGYVDVESERATATRPDSTTQAPPPSTQSTQAQTPAPTRAPTTPDPYSSSPTTAYPATSYGLDSTAATATTLPAVRTPAPMGASGGGGDQNLGNLFYQLQQLQQEVMMLNGKVEEQAHDLHRLREQNLERYVDVDRRIGELGGGASGSPSTGGSVGSGVNSGISLGGNSSVAELPGEGEAYRAAYALVRSQQFDQAVTGFKTFLDNYPAGKYAPNAHYWLGELYLVIKPIDLESSRQAFTLLLNQYPDNSKIPDALYKLGKVHYMKGNRDRAREFFDRVINEYGSSNNAAVTLARDFINENY